MIEAFDSKHFTIGLPVDDADQSLTALFRHVTETLAKHEPISMDELLTIGFEMELGDDAEWHGHFTVVFSPDDGGSTP